MADPIRLPRDKIDSIAHACEDVRQRGSNNVIETSWRRKALLLLNHIAYLEATLAKKDGAVSHD